MKYEVALYGDTYALVCGITSLQMADLRLG